MRRYQGHRITLVALCLLLLVSTLVPAPCFARARNTKNSSLPQPVSVDPDQDWDGVDGSWNTFTLQIGEPPQAIRALISTASQQTWAIHVLACTINATDPSGKTNDTVEQVDSSCFDSRGRTFNVTASTSWQEIGFYQLWTEKNLGLVGNGQYGYDTVGLGLPGAGGPAIKNTTVGTLITPNFWLGHLGLNAKPTNFSAFWDPSPSYMTYLFQQNYIPSLSFGYTAGAQYRLATVLGSLTLGGYDTSRFIPNDLTFGFAPDNERDIVVGIVGIQANGMTRTNVNLLNRDSFTMYIDSTIAELWLPIEVCEAFEDAFGLKYDNATGLYLVDDLLHATLLAENSSVTFSLGQQYSTNETVDIELPYAAFDQEAKPPYQGLENATRYFPIRRAEKENQFVLGRTFLQEAYLIVDWQRQNFTVSACSWMFGIRKEITSIIAPEYTDLTASSARRRHLSSAAIIGIAIGCGFSFAMLVFAIMWWFWWKKQKREMAKVRAEFEAQAAAAATAAKETSPSGHEEPPTSPSTDPEEGTNVFPKAELPAESVGTPELSTDVKERDPYSSAVEVEDTERQVFEMLGDIPTRQEADGRQLSEKESMMARERIYNGTDPTGAPAVSPLSEEPPRRPTPISPSEVTMVTRRRPNVCLTTPQTPRDGAFLEANDTFFQAPARNARDGKYLEVEDTLHSPVSPLDGSTDTSRRRFSYES